MTSDGDNADAGRRLLEEWFGEVLTIDPAAGTFVALLRRQPWHRQLQARFRISQVPEGDHGRLGVGSQFSWSLYVDISEGHRRYSSTLTLTPWEGLTEADVTEAHREAAELLAALKGSDSAPGDRSGSLRF